MSRVPSFSLTGFARRHSIVSGDGTTTVSFNDPVVLKCLADGEVRLIGWDNSDNTEITYPVVEGEVIDIIPKKVISHTLGAGNLIAWE